MVQNQKKRRSLTFLKMDSVIRVVSIPMVETIVQQSQHVYFRIKLSNRIFENFFDTAENLGMGAIETARPIFELIEKPLQKIDLVMCNSLDFIENKIPSIYLPPQMLYWNTKEYMADCLVKPVLKRANSVKNLGNAVLDNKVSNYAADRLDGAFEAADKYIEKYLPDSKDTTDSMDTNNEQCVDNTNEIHAYQTIHKGQQVTRKLKRRLTLRTISEAKALKKQSKEAINILVYAAELIATDPKLALQKSIELWEYLSKDEPENQTRPQTLEELIVMLTTFYFRRIVHIINFTTAFFSKLPKSFKSSTHELAIHFIYVTDSLIKITHLERAKTATVQEVGVVKGKLQSTYDEIQNYTSNALEKLAIFLSGRLEAEKITTNHRRRGNNNRVQNNVNGVY